MPGYEFPLEFPFEAPAQLLAFQAGAALTPTVSMVRARTLALGDVWTLTPTMAMVRARTFALSDTWTLTPAIDMTTYLEEVYGTGIVLVDADGVTYELLGSFALDDNALSTSRASFQPPGRAGALPVTRRRATGRRLRLSGTVEGLQPGTVESLGRVYRGWLAGRLPLKLYRWKNADRYILVRPTRAADDFHRGRFDGRLVSLSFDLEASDPLWYASAPQQITRSVSAGYDQWTVANPGSVPHQQAKVTFRARSNGVINPSLQNGQGGYVAAYTGTLNAGESVVLDGVERTALKGAVNVAPQVNAAWHTDGFPLQPGDNILTYTDSDLSSHACDVSVQWRPAFW